MYCHAGNLMQDEIDAVSLKEVTDREMVKDFGGGIHRSYDNRVPNMNTH
jgi:hypothetical protein